MAYFMWFPYTDMYQMNLDWLLETVKRLEQSTGNGLVNSFNTRSGAVELNAEDVNSTRIDITWISDPGDSISDLSQSELDEMYNNGVRALIFVNNLGTPDQLYFLALVGDVVTPQAYIPSSSTSGVVSVNGRTGTVVLYGTNINLRNTLSETIDGAVTSIRNNIGTLSALTTDVKTSLVAAINEVDSNTNNAATTANNAATAAATAQSTADSAVQSAADVAADVGDIADLETSVTRDVVEAVNSLHDQIVNLQNAKYYSALREGLQGENAGTITLTGLNSEKVYPVFIANSVKYLVGMLHHNNGWKMFGTKTFSDSELYCTNIDFTSCSITVPMYTRYLILAH